jgi:hypothetical protein
MTMTKSLLFWILMLVWLIVGLWWYWPASGVAPAYGLVGSSLLQFLTVGLLGWKVFGPPLQG